MKSPSFTKRIWLGTFLIALGVFFGVYTRLQAASVSRDIGFQGQLFTGTTPVNGSVNATFTFYDDVATGTSQGTPIVKTVPVSNGYFGVTFSEADTAGVDFGQSLWVEVSVNGDVLSPRSKVNSVPVANHALGVVAYSTAPTVGPVGSLYYNASSSELYVSDGSTWNLTSTSTPSVWDTTAGGISYMGNVGIGTTTPNVPLSVLGAGDTPLEMGSWSAGGGANYAALYLNGDFNTDTNYNIVSSASDKDLYINRPSGHAIHFRENNDSDQLTLLSGGNVGVGTDNPVSKFVVAGGGSEIEFNPGMYWDGSTMQLDSDYSNIDIPGTKNLNFSDNVSFTGGNVGIGTLNQDEGALKVYGSVYSTADKTDDILNGSVNGWQNKANFIGTGAVWGLRTGTNDSFNLDMIGSHALTVLQNGNVGIGTTTPGSKLTVAGDINFTGSLLQNGSPFVGSQWTTTGNNLAYKDVGDLNSIEKVYAPIFTTASLAGYPIGLTMDNSSVHDTYGWTSGGGWINFEGRNYGVNLSAPGGWNGNLGVIKFQTGTSGTASEKMRIDSAGNVGIGTSSPIAKLDIYGSSGSSDIFAISSSSNARLFTVTGAGNVGIGTTNPSALLEINGSVDDNNGGLQIKHSNGTQGISIGYSGISAFGGTNSNQSLTLTAKGNWGVGIGSKTDVKNNSLSVLTNNNGVSIGDGTYYVTSAPVNGLLVQGNVGIGTTSPIAKLAVAGDAYVGGNLTATGTVTFTSGTSGRIPFYTTGGQLTDSANFTIANGNTLQASGGLRINNNVLLRDNGENLSVRNNGDAYYVGLYAATANLTGLAVTGNGSITGNLGIGTTTSSARFALVGSGTSTAFLLASSSGATLMSVASDGITNIGSTAIAGGGTVLTLNSSYGSAAFQVVGGGNLCVNGVCSYNNALIATQGQFLGGGYFKTNLGIGTTTPSAKLDIYGTSSSPTTDLFAISSSSNARLFTVTGAGNLGIGSSTPNNLLTIQNGSAITNSVTQAQLYIKNTLNANNGHASAVLDKGNSAASAAFGFLSAGVSEWDAGIIDSNNFIIRDTVNNRKVLTLEQGAPANSLYLNSSGNIGIGTSSPAFALHVVGGASDINGTIAKFSRSATEKSLYISAAFGGSNYISSEGDIVFKTGVTANSALSGTTALTLSGGNTTMNGLRVNGSDSTNTIYQNAPIGITTGGGTQGILIDNIGNVNIRSSTTVSRLYVNNTTGSVGIGTTTPSLGPLVMASGAYVTAGGTWTNASDRNLKENFTDIDGQDILNKIAELPITKWNYKSESTSTTHIGPMAQDFYRIFNLGGSDTSISTIDPAGLALVGVQTLNAEINGVTATGTTSSTTAGIGQTLLTKILASFEELGVKISQGIASFTDLFADKVHTQLLCVGDTCVTESQLKALLQSAGQTATPTQAPAPTTSPTLSPTSEDTGSTTDSSVLTTTPVDDTSTTTNSDVSADSNASASTEVSVPVSVPESVPESVPTI